MNWMTLALRKYAVFTGRARRKEFWMFVLFYLFVLLIAAVFDKALGTTFKITGQSLGFGLFYTLVSLSLLIPAISVSVRRLHDINKSGWYIFVHLILLVGQIWFIIMAITEGNKGDNQYGPDPKADENVF